MAENKPVAYWNSYPPAGVTPAGSPLCDEMAWNKDQTALVKVGERNLQEEYNAAAVGLTPYEVLKRVVATGDESPLNAQEGQYGDFSGMPETTSEAVHVMEEAAEAAKDPDVIKALNPDPAPAASAAADKGAEKAPEGDKK